MKTKLDYRTQYEQILAKKLCELNRQNLLHTACEYAMTGTGGRIRPIIVLLIADALGYGREVSASALSIEYFHTASLVADDLPSMDDDDMRRNKPSLHMVYGESMALLTSYALIAEGYRSIAENGEIYREAGNCSDLDLRMIAVLDSAATNAGLNGAAGGQFLDLSPPTLSEKSVREIIQKKTGSLFEYAFVAGWIFGGGILSFLPLVKKTAQYYGLIFQIVDDFDDILSLKPEKLDLLSLNI